MKSIFDGFGIGTKPTSKWFASWKEDKWDNGAADETATDQITENLASFGALIFSEKSGYFLTGGGVQEKAEGSTDVIEI